MMKPTSSLLVLCVLQFHAAIVTSFTHHIGIETKNVFHFRPKKVDPRFVHFSRHLSTSVTSRSQRLRATPAAYIPEDIPISCKEFKFVSDFKEGFNRVHSDYLNLFWKYSFVKAMRYILPVSMVLASTRYLVPEFGKALIYGFGLSFRGFYRLSSVVDLMLFLPLKAAWAMITTIPWLMIPLLEYIPQSAAIGIISPILFLRRMMKSLSSSFLFSTLAISVWRPVLEETQYRFLLNSALGDKGLRRLFGRSTSKDAESGSGVDTEKNDLSISEPQGSISKACLWTSFLFALTRFGWLCSNFQNDSTSPYSWTVGFSLSLLGHLSSVPLSEVRSVLQYASSLLAIHQAVTTFLVAVNIYQPMYSKNGLFGSIGSHIAWTTGIPTIPFRLAKKIYDGSKKTPNTTEEITQGTEFENST